MACKHTVSSLVGSNSDRLVQQCDGCFARKYTTRAGVWGRWFARRSARPKPKRAKRAKLGGDHG